MTKDAKISRELTSCLFHALNDVKKIVDKYEKKLENAVLSSSGSSYADSASGRKRKKMTKAERNDPSRVKKPHTTYIRFVMETRPQVEAEYPNISQGDLMKELGKRWKDLSDTKREEYKRQYEEAKKRIKRQKKIQGQDDHEQKAFIGGLPPQSAAVVMDHQQAVQLQQLPGMNPPPPQFVQQPEQGV